MGRHGPWLRMVSHGFFPFVAGISLASDGSGDIYVGLDNGKVYKTTDQAENWSPTGDLPSNSERIAALVGIDAATVLAGTGGNGIYKTVDGGDTWVQIINSGLPESAILLITLFSWTRLPDTFTRGCGKEGFTDLQTGEIAGPRFLCLV